MFGFSREGGRPSLLIGTLKSAVVIAVLSYAAANFLSSGTLDRNGLSQLASLSGRDVFDPVTTGSIDRVAGRTRLDPCAAPRHP